MRVQGFWFGFGFILGLVFLAWAALTPVEAGMVSDSYASDYLCPPSLQLRHPKRCPGHGPGGQLGELAQQGIFPEHPFPVESLDPSLGYVPFNYRRLPNQGINIYPSVGAALSGQGESGRIDRGILLMVSWIDCTVQNGRAVYMISPGAYVQVGNSCKTLALTSFHGSAFYRTPSLKFAWILGGTYTSRLPGPDEPLTNHWVNRYDQVWIYDVEHRGGLDWYCVGPDEWVEQRLIAMVDPDPAPPPGVQGDRWISIDLYEQTLMVYEEGELVYATLISGGVGGWETRPGVFQVFDILEKDRMSGAYEADRSDFYYLEDVPWVLYYDESRAIHGAYWHNNFGYPTSHGCVNLSPTDAHWLYEWAEEGSWVYVWDSSEESDREASGS